MKPDAPQTKPLTAKVLLKGFVPERRHRGKRLFIDEKLRVFSPGKWSLLYSSPRRGFLVEVDAEGRPEPLNLYKDPRGHVFPRTLNRWLKEDWEIRRDIERRRREAKNLRAIRPTALVPVQTPNLPRKVLVLDIETSGKLDEGPSPERIALAGLKEFNLEAGGYRPSSYEPFDGLPDWEPLRRRLGEPADLILGHNTFGFDYYFLEQVVDLEGVAARSVDLFLWLCSCVGYHRGLSLNDLCRLNLGIWKTRFGKPMKKLAAQPDKAELHRYNERDLDLTFRLWLHAISQKPITSRGPGSWKATQGDLDFLSGRKPLIVHRTWLETKRDWKSKQPSPLHREAILRRLGPHDADRVVWPSYRVIFCSACRRTRTFVVTEPFERRVEDGEDFPGHFLVKKNLGDFRLMCPCGRSAKVRCLTPPDLIGTSEPYRIGRSPLHEDAATSPKICRILVDREDDFRWNGKIGLIDDALENCWRNSDSWMQRQTVKAEGHCQICGAPLTIHDIPLVHPHFKTPACQPCLRLGRHRYFHQGEWLPELKRRRLAVADSMVPTNESRNLTDFYVC